MGLGGTMGGGSVCESETASCTAITEKRQEQRTGGCTGILFRLFDWNRRLAKKKLFSRKLLPPPAHQAKQAAKKYKGDEKKLHLIADENKGGFPKLKKNAKGSDALQKHEMRAPCLVARLMGLDLMPAVQRDKAKKPSLAAASRDESREFVAVGTDREDGSREGLHLEKGRVKHEIRPQKLRKTGLSERQASTRFAPGGMQLKGVLSRSGKHHHPKLVTPVKSPRASSARTFPRVSRSRLIDAATRILEPGLVAKNKYTYALSYPSDMSCTPPDDVVLVGSQIRSAGGSNRPGTSLAMHFAGHAACRNCGCVLENADFRPVIAARRSDCAASTSNLFHTPHPSQATQPQSSPSPGEQEKKVSCMPSQQNAVSPAMRLKNDPLEHCRLPRNESPATQKFEEDQGWIKSRQRDESSHIASKHGAMKQRRPSSREERMPTVEKVGNFRKRRTTSPADSVDSAKAFIGFNSRPTGQTNEMVSALLGTSYTDAYEARTSCLGRANTSSQVRTPVQKRRFMDVERLVETPSFLSSTSRGWRNPKCPTLTGKEKEVQVHYYDDALIKRRSCSRAKGRAASPRFSNSAISSASNSSVTHMGEISPRCDAASPFSNCSCIRWNKNGVSGLEVHPEFENYTSDRERPFGFGNLSEQVLPGNIAIGLYARTSKTICNFDVARASRYELNHAPRVGLDEELLFADANSFSFLLNKLEMSAHSSLSSITRFMHLDTENRRHQLREFLLDCLFECLDSMPFCYTRCSPRKKLPPSMDLDTLVKDVEVEIGSWARLSGMSIDEIIEWEMGHSFEKWTEFRDESLENGIAIDSYIFQSLVDEIVEDLRGAGGPRYSY